MSGSLWEGRTGEGGGRSVWLGWSSLRSFFLSFFQECLKPMKASYKIPNTQCEDKTKEPSHPTCAAFLLPPSTKPFRKSSPPETQRERERERKRERELQRLPNFQIAKTQNNTDTLHPICRHQTPQCSRKPKNKQCKNQSKLLAWKKEKLRK